MRHAFRAKWADYDADTATRTGWDDCHMVWVTLSEGGGTDGPEESGTSVTLSRLVSPPGPDRHTSPGDERDVEVYCTHQGALAFQGCLDVRQCRLTRERLSVDFEPRSEDSGGIDGIDIELDIDQEHWDSLGWGLKKLLLESPEILDLPERFHDRSGSGITPSESEESQGEAIDEDDIPY